MKRIILTGAAVILMFAAACVTKPAEQTDKSGSAAPAAAVTPTRPSEKAVSAPAPVKKPQPAPVASPAKQPTAAPTRRYFRPAADKTPVLPKITVPQPMPPSETRKTETDATKQTAAVAAAEAERSPAVIRVVDRSELLKNVKSDSFYFSAMVFRFDTASLTARLQFERVPNRPEFAALAQNKILFKTFFPSEEFFAAEEKQTAVSGGGLGFEIAVRARSGAEDPLETLAALLSLLLQRPIQIAESGSPARPICEFSFACDPVMTFSSPNSYGMYTNQGGERVTFSFNLRNDSEVLFRLAY
ncbi:MAG: hypothetical protein SOZ27_04300 [Spirochaetia bacterium]|nr:hypothetical protein [Spirochaetia bacterium]